VVLWLSKHRRLVAIQAGLVASAYAVSLVFGGITQGLLLGTYLFGVATLTGIAAVSVWQIGLLAPRRSAVRISLWVFGAAGLVVMLSVGFVEGVILGGHPAALEATLYAGLYGIAALLIIGLVFGWTMHLVTSLIARM
jgi:hypothetical protein